MAATPLPLAAALVKVEEAHPLSAAEGVELAWLLQHYVHEKLSKRPNSMSLRAKADDPCRLQRKYSALFAAATELQTAGMHGQLLRLLRTLKHYETVGVLRGEAPPCADYAGRQHRVSDDAEELEELIDLTNDDAPERSFEAVDVERWALSAEYPQALAQLHAASAARRAVKQELAEGGGEATATPAAVATAPAAAKRKRPRASAERCAKVVRRLPLRPHWEGDSDEEEASEEGEGADE